MIITFQEFEKHVTDRAKWIGQAIAQYKRSDEYAIALDADAYDAKINTTINKFVKVLYDITGVPMVDFTSSNNRLSSGFFHRFNVQRNSYLLGNGVTFASRVETEEIDEKGIRRTVFVDKTKEALGKAFDAVVQEAGYKALIHRACYVFYNDGEYHIFPLTEFMPLLDAETGVIRAGMRFWSLDWSRSPITVDLYEEDGYSRYRTKDKKYGLGALELIEEKRHYKEIVEKTEADGEQVISGEDYNALPIIPCYANEKKISTLPGLKPDIDAYDLIKSGFANDETDIAQIYWLISNAMGMRDEDVQKFKDRLLLQHVAVVDSANAEVSAQTNEVPYNSREACLNRLQSDMYRDFGALDVSLISGGQSKTATEINAAYSPLDEETDLYEKEITKFIKGILSLLGIEDEPVYKRNKVTNQKEETEMIMSAANKLDDRTVVSKLPFITPDEVSGILARKEKEISDRMEE